MPNYEKTIAESLSSVEGIREVEPQVEGAEFTLELQNVSALGYLELAYVIASIIESPAVDAQLSAELDDAPDKKTYMQSLPRAITKRSGAMYTQSYADALFIWHSLYTQGALRKPLVVSIIKIGSKRYPSYKVIGDDGTEIELIHESRSSSIVIQHEEVFNDNSKIMSVWSGGHNQHMREQVGIADHYNFGKRAVSFGKGGVPRPRNRW